MGGNFRLVEDDLFFSIHTGGNVGCSHFARVACKLFRVLPDCDCVHIDHAIDAFVSILKPHKMANGAQIIAQMKVAGGLNPRKYAIFWLFHDFSYLLKAAGLGAAVGQ